MELGLIEKRILNFRKYIFSVYYILNIELGINEIEINRVEFLILISFWLKIGCLFGGMNILLISFNI